MKSPKQNKRGGFYWIQEKPYVSVTEVLKIIDKPQLRYWFGKQVYLSMVENPQLSEKEAMSAPYKKSDKAKSRGSSVHSIVEACKTGTEVKFELAETEKELGGYRDAFLKWINELNVKVVENEKTVISEKYKYAGTLDLLVRINGNKELTLVDVKTGKDIYPESFIQTSAYKYALKEQGVEVKETATLLLNENGTYKYAIGGDEIKGFLAAKYLYESINREDLIKLGYLEK